MHVRLLCALLTASALAACGPPRPATLALLPRHCDRVRAGGPRPWPPVRTGSSVALARLGPRTLAYVADGDGRAIRVVDVDAKVELSSTALPGRPAQLMFLPDGRLAATLRDRGQVAILEPGPEAASPLDLRCAAETSAEPLGLALTADEGNVLVTSGWGRSLASYDAKGEMGKAWEVELPREPRGVVVSADGVHAFVAHAAGGIASIVDLRAHSVATTATHLELSPTDAADNGSLRTSGQGFALAKMGDRVLLPQVLVETGVIPLGAVASDLPPRQPQDDRAFLDDAQSFDGAGYGGGRDPTEVPDVAVLDGVTGQTRLPADAGRVRSSAFVAPGSHARCLLPRAAAVDGERRWLLVACLGVDEVVAYDASAADPLRSEQRTWAVGAGPTGIAVDPRKDRAIVWSEFDRTLAVLSLATSALPVRIGLAATADAVDPSWATGRLLFHAVGDTRISRDGRACASCHPDGRDDGLTWQTPEGGRRTILLAGRVHEGSPLSWIGPERSLDQHLKIAISRLGGTGRLGVEDRRSLESFVRSLAPPAAASSASTVAERGRRIFQSRGAGCATCHAGPLGTDNKPHMIQGVPLNTPSLLAVGHGGPYFHDGRYATLHELLADPELGMGDTSHLSGSDRDALEAYLQSL